MSRASCVGMTAEVTALLAAAAEGQPNAEAELMPVVYDELHRRASALMRQEKSEHSLQATARVHEAYMSLVQQEGTSFQNRGHFYALASRLMRRILVDHARRKNRDKRGGNRIRMSWNEDVAPAIAQTEDLLELDDALQKLAALAPRQADVVVMRFFGGLTVSETAEALDVSKRTIEAEWTMAKAWLKRELRR